MKFFVINKVGIAHTEQGRRQSHTPENKKMKPYIGILQSFLAYLVLSMATFLMLRMILDYSSMRTNIHFLQFKQDYIHLPWWKAAFYIHVFSSVLALAAGFTQFSDHILKHYRTVHRIIGRLYAVDILFINFPAGMVLAVEANGLWPSKTAFIILDCLWFYFTLRAVSAARQGKIAEHKRFMFRSYALTFSAITLRTWKIILLNTFHPDPLSLYMIDAWMGFVPNLLLVEWLIRRKPWKQGNKTTAPSIYYRGKEGPVPRK